jgi:translation elongation factor EF-Tu-like GTPase
MSSVPGSTIPGFYEGTPLRSDNFMYTFTAAGTISVGQVVALTTTGYQVTAASGTGTFLFGVALTAGQLGQAINVILRGITDAVADGAITTGQFVAPSGSTAGRVVATNFVSSFSAGQLPRAIALSSATAAGQTIQIELF